VCGWLWGEERMRNESRGPRDPHRSAVARAWRHHKHVSRSSAARHHGHTVSKNPKTMLVAGCQVSHGLV
jgi:hypothetical protein